MLKRPYFLSSFFHLKAHSISKAEPSANWRKVIFESLFIFFIISLFLTAGADFESQYQVRLWAGGILLSLFLFFFAEKILFHPSGHLTLFLFLCLVFYEMIRALWAISFSRTAAVDPDFIPLIHFYIAAPVPWVFYFAFMGISFSYFDTRPQINRFLIVMAACGFFLALNALPPLLQEGHLGYPLYKNQFVFFWPWLYFHPWVAKYGISDFAHTTWVGDMMALGFFPAFALVLYGFEKLKGECADGSINPSGFKRQIVLLLLGFAGVLTIAAGIYLLLARDTAVLFSISFITYLLCVYIKFPARPRAVFFTSVFLLMAVLLSSVVVTKKLWGEFSFARSDFNPAVESNFFGNQEAAKIALTIAQAHPFLGVGTNGYSAVSTLYAKAGVFKVYPLAKFQGMCHYLHLMAEEGIGAYLYFLMLLAYFYESVQGLYKTYSHFKFIAALSLLCPVLMILLHASIHHLMQRFPVAMLVYISMGVSLRILRTDFH